MKDNVLVQHFKIKIDALKKLCGWSFHESLKYYKFILKTRDRRIIIFKHSKIFLLKLDNDL